MRRTQPQHGERPQLWLYSTVRSTVQCGDVPNAESGENLYSAGEMAWQPIGSCIVQCGDVPNGKTSIAQEEQYEWQLSACSCAAQYSTVQCGYVPSAERGARARASAPCARRGARGSSVADEERRRTIGCSSFSSRQLLIALRVGKYFRVLVRYSPLSERAKRQLRYQRGISNKRIVGTRF